MIDDSTLWATDALLDSLALGDLPEDDDRGLQLLSALVLDVSADLPTASPVPDEVRARRSRLLRLAPRTGVALAAAVAVVSTGGVAAASVNAGPTSALFPLHQVLTGQPQLDGSQRQALEVRDKLKSATKALAVGKVDRAQRDVTAAAKRISKVAEADGRSALTAQWVVVSRQVKARAVTPVTPAKPTQTVLPTPTHSPSLTPKPAVTPSPTGSPTTHSTPSPRTVPTTTPAVTSAASTSPPTVPVVPTSPQPSTTGTGTPEPSGSVGSPAPSATGSPATTDSPTPGTHHGKGGKPTPTPSAAAGSPVDPIVITPAPTETPSQPPQSPNDQVLPMPSSPAAVASSAPPASAPAPSAAVVVPPSALPLP